MKKDSLLRKLAARIPEADRIFYRKADDVAARIIDVMQSRGLTQRDLAERLDKTESYVSRVLGGGVNLTLKTIAAFEAALDTDVLIPAGQNAEPVRRRSTFTSSPKLVQLSSPRAISAVAVGEDGNLQFRTQAPVNLPTRILSSSVGNLSLQTSRQAHEEIACAS